jgi:hypothetical protein
MAFQLLNADAPLPVVHTHHINNTVTFVTPSCRVVSTKLPASGVTVGTTYIKEPGNSTKRRHQLKIVPLGRSGNPAAVFFEQPVWGVAHIVSGDNAVIGGGLVHIVDAVSTILICTCTFDYLNIYMHYQQQSRVGGASLRVWTQALCWVAAADERHAPALRSPARR